jgi:hypothetical protein
LAVYQIGTKCTIVLSAFNTFGKFGGTDVICGALARQVQMTTGAVSRHELLAITELAPVDASDAKS